MMIQLSHGCHVAAEQIAEVTVSDYGNITVRTKGGVGHSVSNDYGDRSGYSTRDRLIAEINAARKNAA
ncbi:hypothetical protein [Noviherbaspirillum saxi]|uniref:Uncharacterized protein n=1 Tax=Noviherbaspirillum saxi TaxID=2320863 RepID=A0A3A3FXV5_9BURK|nr:hypothetical protein [Noviherbaspirillum saxi]RJF99031.1 hypothetical protein D3871_11300 [Noviherbaspirillum saxi]